MTLTAFSGFMRSSRRYFGRLILAVIEARTTKSLTLRKREKIIEQVMVRYRLQVFPTILRRNLDIHFLILLVDEKLPIAALNASDCIVFIETPRTVCVLGSR